MWTGFIQSWSSERKQTRQIRLTCSFRGSLVGCRMARSQPKLKSLYLVQVSSQQAPSSHPAQVVSCKIASKRYRRNTRAVVRDIRDLCYRRRRGYWGRGVGGWGESRHGEASVNMLPNHVWVQAIYASPSPSRAPPARVALLLEQEPPASTLGKWQSARCPFYS